MLASLSLSLSFSPLSPPKIPDTFTAVITSDTSGTSHGTVPKGKSSMKQWYDYANKRLRKDADDGTTKVYRYDVKIDPPFPARPGDPTFPTPKGYQFDLANPNMTCCWLWLMDSDTKEADMMEQLTIPKKAKDLGADANGEHWASSTHFPLTQTGDFWCDSNVTSGCSLTKENSFVNIPKAFGPQAGTIITNSTYEGVTIGPIDESAFWVPDATPTFGQCKEFGKDPMCQMNDAAALLADIARHRAMRVSKGDNCKAMENPTCKGVSSAPSKCAYTGCKKCHDETTWDCDECCDGCTRTEDPTKGIHYCAGPKEADPLQDDLVEFLK